MKRLTGCLTLLALAVWFASPASAQEEKEGKRKPSPEMMQRLLEKFDANGDGKLDDDEKAKAREARAKRFSEERKGGKGREMMMKKFDTDGDGELNETEKAALHEAMEKRRAEGGGPGGFSREEFMKKFDANGDGTLDEGEKQQAKAAFGGRGPGKRGPGRGPGKGGPGGPGKGQP